MKIKRYSALLVGFLLLSNIGFSQGETSQLLDTLCYLFPQFTNGTITMKDGSVTNGKFNYNMIIDEMQFIDAKDGILSLAEPEKVIKLVIANRNFIFLKNSFMEFISEGPVSLLLRIHVKRTVGKIGAYGGVSYASSIESLSSYNNNDGSVTKLSANEKVSYQRELIYSLMYNDKMKVVYSQNDLLKFFSSNKDKLKLEMDNQHTKLSSIESMKKIIEWINLNGIKN